MADVVSVSLRTVMSRNAPLGTTPLQKESPFDPPSDDVLLTPYVHQDYPKVIYRFLPDGRIDSRIVQTAEELAAAKPDGFSVEYPKAKK